LLLLLLYAFAATADLQRDSQLMVLPWSVCCAHRTQTYHAQPRQPLMLPPPLLLPPW
jgi:hypothetical protein